MLLNLQMVVSVIYMYMYVAFGLVCYVRITSLFGLVITLLYQVQVLKEEAQEMGRRW